VERARAIQATLVEVDDSSLEKWLGDVRKDRNPEREIRVWETIAQAYESYCSTHTLNLEARQDVLRLLLTRSGMNGEQEVLANVTLHSLTRDQALEVIRGFKGTAMPIQVERQ
jgi:hypothetical protein